MRERRLAAITELSVLVNAPEAVSAAVQNGADIVYASLSTETRLGLSLEEFNGAAKFCRVRGVKLFADLDIAPKDSLYEGLITAARAAWLNGADGIRASDPGLMLAIRRCLPEAPIHCGSIADIQVSEGARLVFAMGAERSATPPQLFRDDIKSLISASPLGIEVPVHGFLSPSWPGRLLLPGWYGDGSERLGGKWTGSLRHYKTGVKGATPLVLPDLCLLKHVPEIRDMGAAAICLDGRDRRPEYVAAVTALYRRALSGVKVEADTELAALMRILPVSGYTDGCYLGKGLYSSFTYDVKPAEKSSAVLSELRKSYLRREFQRVPVSFTAKIALGQPITITAEDDRGNSASGEGGTVEVAFHRDYTLTDLQTELYKTGGTPFLCGEVRAEIQKGVAVEPADIAEIRDRLLEELMKKREFLAQRTSLPFVPFGKAEPPTLPPVLTVSVTKASQLTKKLLELSPPVVYIPIEEIKANQDAVLPFIETEGISVSAVMPPVFTESDKPRLTSLLLAVRQLGVEEALCDNLGHALFLRSMGFKVRGGMGIGIVSSGTMEVLKSLKLRSVTLSPELDSAEVKAIQKHIPAELTVYGRVPMALAEPGLSIEGFDRIPDRDGIAMPIIKGYGGKETLLSAKKLFLARSAREYMASGLYGVRLAFTTESEDEAISVTERYLGIGKYEPASFTRGLF